MFNRNQNIFIKKIMKKEYENKVNIKNIMSLSKRKIKNIFENEDSELKEIYLHNLVDKWYFQNKDDQDILKKINRLIKKTSITLNQIEKNNIRLISERSFSLERHIKILDVNEKLFKNEQVGIKFTNATIYKKKDILFKIASGTLLISNKRIIINGENKIIFNWSSVNKINFEKYGFIFFNNKIEYVLRIHDQITLNNTIKNFIRKKVKKWRFEKY